MAPGRYFVLDTCCTSCFACAAAQAHYPVRVGLLQRFSLLNGLGFESSVARALRHVDLHHAIPETCGQQTGATSAPRQVLTCNMHSLIAWSSCNQWQLRRQCNLLSGSWGIAGVTWRQRAPGGGGAAAPAADA